MKRSWMPLVCALGLLFVHWLVMLFVSQIATLTYWLTMPILQMLEQFGLPTLRGSADGWAMPTQFGLILSFVGWYFVYAGAIYIARAARRSISPRATQTI